MKEISRGEVKRLILSGYLGVLSFSVTLIYSAFDLINGVFYSQPSYVIQALASLCSLYLLGKGKIKSGKLLLIMTTNLVVFWAAITDPFETGVFLLFIPAGIGSFAMLGSEDTRIAVRLAGLTTLLFLAAYFVYQNRVSIPPPDPLYIKMSLLINYIISFTISVLAIRFLIKLNQESENELIRKEITAKQKNDELKKVNVELDRFVYSVSHDLRSPLSSIQGLINIGKLSDDPDELKQIFRMIEDRVNSQDQFIKEIIDYSRNTRTETRRDPVEIGPLVNEIIDSLRYSLNADRIRFDILIPEGSVIHSDKIRLTVILSNLIGNAIKYHDFTKSDPFIEIAFDPFQTKLSVRDNGMGIDPHHVHRIFDMFYRGSERSKGSGLGLFITKETISRLGGTVTVNSEPGKGSMFEVSLPA